MVPDLCLALLEEFRLNENYLELIPHQRDSSQDFTHHMYTMNKENNKELV